MPYTNAYFTLTWSAGTVTKYFRLQMEEANPHGYLQHSTFQRNIDAGLLEIAPAGRKRIVEGVVRCGETEPEGWGTLANLLTANAATDLTCQMYGDGAAWNARWVSEWRPINIDPLGNYFAVPMVLEEK